MAVKGSGGDLRSITNAGFAILYMDKLNSLIARYRGEALEDEMVSLLSALRVWREPGRRVDRHAAACISAVSACRSPASRLGYRAGGKRQRRAQAAGIQSPVRTEDRVGAVAAARLRAGADAEARGRGTPGGDGLILGGHGLFTWGETQKECYLNSIRTIDEMGEFIEAHQSRGGKPLFGGPAMTARSGSPVDRRRDPSISARRRVLEPAGDRARGQLGRCADVCQFEMGGRPCRMGTSCPDHFLRTRISPMFIPWNPGSEDIGAARQADRRARRDLSQRLRGVLQGLRRASVTEAARFEPFGGRRSRPGSCSDSARTSAKRASPPSSSSTRSM